MKSLLLFILTFLSFNLFAETFELNDNQVTWVAGASLFNRDDILEVLSTTDKVLIKRKDGSFTESRFEGAPDFRAFRDGKEWRVRMNSADRQLTGFMLEKIHETLDDAVSLSLITNH